MLLKLLPGLDNLILAEKHTQDEGVKISIEHFVDSLEQEGVKKIDTEAFRWRVARQCAKRCKSQKQQETTQPVGQWQVDENAGFGLGKCRFSDGHALGFFIP